MKVDKEQMPFRFYKDEYDGLKPAVYEDYITEMLKAYHELGGDISSDPMNRFISIDENGQYVVNMKEIIEDCTAYDDKMISDKEVEGALDEFEEDKYGLAGFLGRYTTIDRDKLFKKYKEATTDEDKKKIIKELCEKKPLISSLEGKSEDEILTEMDENLQQIEEVSEKIRELEKKKDSLTKEEESTLKSLKEEKEKLESVYDVKGISHKDVGKKALKNLEEKSQGLEGDKKRISDSNKVLFAHLATTNFLARSTIVTAAQMVADGAMMQIGCSQGKTTVLAYASYINMVKGVNVMNTSSNPGLVLDNFSEFEEPYDALGVSKDMVAITRDGDGKDMIVLRPELPNGMNITTKIREDGKISIPDLEEVKEPKKVEEPHADASKSEIKAYEKYLADKDKYDKALEKRDKLVEKFTELFGEDFKKLHPKQQEEYVEKYLEKVVLSKEFEGCDTFEKKVEMCLYKPLVMADTMTLMKYDEYVPNYSDNNDAEKKVESICMCDEADCEFLDARPYEVTGKEYSDKAQEKRFEKRKIADSLIVEAMKDENFNGSMETLKQIAAKNKIPLEFLKDAYDVRSSLTREGEDYVIDDEGKMTTLNSAKRTLEQDTQGHEQAIYAMRANQGKVDKVPKEKEVLDVKYPYQVIGKYDVHSLISGTMEDRGLSKFKEDGKSLYDRFSKARAALFKSMGFRTPETEEVVNYKTVGPLTREDKGNVFSNLEEITVDEEGKLQGKEDFSLDGKSWGDFIDKNRDKLESNWVKSVNDEIARRKGKPVVVSVLNEDMGKRLGAKEVFTDAHKPTKPGVKMFFKKGQAYFMDDAYGRGYNSKFEGKDGHVLITALPPNSRNLEQFLFRVARGGDDGSSSMVISPTDPKLIEFLEDLDKKIENDSITEEIESQYKGLFTSEEWDEIKNNPKELTNQYFTKLMQGKIPVDRLVFDMYPEETLKVMEQMQVKNDYSKKTLEKINETLESLSGKIDVTDKNICAYMEKALKVSRVKHIKVFDGENLNKSFDQIHKEAAVNVLMALVKSGKNINIEMFKVMMPAGYDENELESIYNLSIERVNERNNIEVKEQEAEESIESKSNNESEVTINSGDEEILEAIDDYELEAEEIVEIAKKAKEEKITQKDQEYDEGPDQ